MSFLRSHSFTLFCETESTTNSARLTTESQLSLLPQLRTVSDTSAWLFTWARRIRLRVPCWPKKHFANWAIPNTSGLILKNTAGHTRKPCLSGGLRYSSHSHKVPTTISAALSWHRGDCCVRDMQARPGKMQESMHREWEDCGLVQAELLLLSREDLNPTTNGLWTLQAVLNGWSRREHLWLPRATVSSAQAYLTKSVSVLHSNFKMTTIKTAMNAFYTSRHDCTSPEYS